MALSATTKTVLIRGAKALAAAAIAATATFLASPDVLGWVGTSHQWLITVLAVPGLLSLEKYVGVKKAAKAANVTPPATPVTSVTPNTTA